MAKPGPCTPEGKAALIRSRVTHGLTSSSTVLPGMDSEVEWQEFLDAVFRDLAPGDGIEAALTHAIASALWRLRRAATAEIALYAEDCSAGPPTAGLEAIGRHETRIKSQLHRAFRALDSRRAATKTLKTTDHLRFEKGRAHDRVQPQTAALGCDREGSGGR